MLDPEYIFHMAEGAEDISEQLHQAIINAIVGRLMARLAKGENYLTSTDRWNLKVLTDAGYLMEDIQREIAARTKLQMEEMRRIFEDAAIESFAWDMAVYQAAGLSPVPLAKSPQLIRLLQQDYIKTAGEWQNFTGTMADAAQQTFIRQCDEAYHLVTSGAMGYPQAVRRAIEAIAADGVTVQYTRWNERGQLEVYHTDTIETATLRAVRTGARQACDAISDARMDEMDWDIVLASAHLGARTGDGGENYTNHYWWQGKFYSRSGKDKRFPPWSDVGEGDVQGFGGPNCRHSKGPGDGVHNPFEHFDSEENRKRELLDQRQRLLERRVRKTRREVMTLQDAIDKAPDDATRAELEAAHRKKAALLQRQEDAYDTFCKENDLRKLYDRLEVARYGPKQAKAAAQAAADLEKEREAIAGGLGRRTKNTGAFAHLPERMSKKHIRAIADEYGIPLKGVKIVIDPDVEKLRPGFMVSGRADTQRVGRIDFFPKAFLSKEELTRTLFHEKIHVEQFRKFGTEYVQNNRAYFERLAYEAENEFIENLRKEGKL